LDLSKRGEELSSVLNRWFEGVLFVGAICLVDVGEVMGVLLFGWIGLQCFNRWIIYDLLNYMLYTPSIQNKIRFRKLMDAYNN
jgi:hypothetical protein